MKRRTVLGLFGLTGASVLSVGTGAFSTVSADRGISVSVVDDNDAYLRLSERGTGRRSFEDGHRLGFDIPGPAEDDYGGTDPEGLGKNSVYRFGGDAAHDEIGLFDVTNQGTQPVEVYSTQQTTDGNPSVMMYDVDTGDVLTESSPSAPLDVGGDPLVCGLEIDTHGVSVQESDYDVTLTINAVATDSN